MTTDEGGWTLAWKYNRDNCVLENVKKWGTNANIATNGYCNMADLSSCSGNHKGALFEDLSTQLMAVNMQTNEYHISSWAYSETTLGCSVHQDTRPTYSGNVFTWKGNNHRYTKGAGDYYYTGTEPCVSSAAGGSLDANHWRTTYLR